MSYARAYAHRTARPAPVVIRTCAASNSLKTAYSAPAAYLRAAPTPSATADNIVSLKKKRPLPGAGVSVRHTIKKRRASTAADRLRKHLRKRYAGMRHNQTPVKRWPRGLFLGHYFMITRIIMSNNAPFWPVMHRKHYGIITNCTRCHRRSWAT